jgi:hypothetical protein
MSHGTPGPNAPKTPGRTNLPSETSSEPPHAAPVQEGEFRLTRGWVFVGLVALALGLVAGLVMSTSWLR